jgi:DNA-binding CsgD family transcriptional regulator
LKIAAGLGLSMTLSAKDAQALDAALVAAPFVVGGWQKALGLLAKAGGAWAGQLIGLTPVEGLIFHVEHGFTSEQMAQLERMGGYLGEVNPRIGAMAQAMPHQVLSEPDFVSVEERGRSALYQELLASNDSDLSCIGRLNPIGNMQVAWCVLRPGQNGDYSNAERHALRMALPSMDVAVRLHMAVEQRGAQLVGQAFENLGVAAFLFDRQGRVITLSQAAVGMVQRQTFLRLNRGQLTATEATCNSHLQQAIHRSCRSDSILDAPLPVALRSIEGVVVADIARVPLDGPSFGSGAAAIMLVPQSPTHENVRAALTQAFGLTAAEANIAALLAAGTDVQQVARLRRASIQTVRSQIKTILSKTGARSQAHLVAIIAGRIPL